MKKDIIIIGTGGHALNLVDIIESTDEFNLIGFTALSEDKEFLGYDILGNDDVLQDYYDKGIRNVGIGVGGGLTSNVARIKIYDKVKEMGFNVPNLIHKTATVSNHSKLGDGLVLFMGVVIAGGVEIGNNVVVMTLSSINHGSKIMDNSTVSAHVIIAADVLIKENVFITPGVSTSSGGIVIEEDIVVGLGAAVTKSLDVKGGVYVGTPARLIKRKE